MIFIILGVIILIGLFNPYTGLFGNTYYSPKKNEKSEKLNKAHRSFRLTKAN